MPIEPAETANAPAAMTAADAANVARFITSAAVAEIVSDSNGQAILARTAEYLRQAAVNGVPEGTEAKVCNLIASRQRHGIAKYGMTVANNPLALRAWLKHALEESLDQAVYLMRAIEEIDAQTVATVKGD